MGLDTTHDCWHGPYSAFHRWRREIAKAAGIPLDFMEGFWSSPLEQAPSGHAGLSLRVAADSIRRACPQSNIPDNLLRRFEAFPIRWEILKDDPLHILLSHSDCDGTIASKDCAAIADRLESLLPLLPKEPDCGPIGYRRETWNFIIGLRDAASKGEDVEFH